MQINTIGVGGGICVNKEVVEQDSHAQIALECCCFVKNSCDASRKRRNDYQHLFDFDIC